MTTEEMRYIAGAKGFKKKDYGLMYEYLILKGGSLLADYFLKQDKKYKRCFCARIVYYFHPGRVEKEKAEKYYKKHRKEFEL